MHHRMDLRLFEDGGGAAPAGQGTNAGEQGNGSGAAAHAGASYSFAQAEEIANARAARAEQAALRSYFQQQGMTQEEAGQALAQFKAQREAQKPDVGRLAQERDDARKELETYKQKDVLREKGVDAKYADYVLFEASKKMDDRTDFKAALEAFLKENPQYAGGGYRVNVRRGTADAGTNAAAGEPSAGNNANNYVNSIIRKAAGR